MMLTTKQALKFVGIASKGQAKTYFEALLGDEEVPTISDFKSDDADKHERAGCFLDCVQTILGELTEHLQTQPRQLDFTKQVQTTNESAQVAVTTSTKKKGGKRPAKRKKANAKKTPAKKKGKK